MTHLTSIAPRGLCTVLLMCAAAAPLLAQESGPAVTPVPIGTSAPIGTPPTPAGTPEKPGTAASPETPTPPPDPAAADAQESFFRSTDIGGLVDAYYDYYSTKPAGDAQFRNFDTKHNQFALSMAQVWIAKAATSDSRTGFKVKLNFGPGSTLINAYEPGTNEFIQNIEEGYLTYLAPIGKGLQVDVGKFVTQHGAEVIEAKDNWNYSRSLLFALAIPYYHSGVRATYAINDKVTVMGNIVNGWNNVVENNSAKTIGAQVIVKPVPALSIVQNYMAGAEQANDSDGGWRRLSDSIVTYTISPAFSVMANYDYGTDMVAGQRVRWQGIAGYAKAQLTKWLADSPRMEWYDDPSGFTTGTVQALREATGTIELKPSDALLWRIEVRHDFSDEAVFKMPDGALKKSQTSIGFGVLYSFSTKS